MAENDNNLGKTISEAISNGNLDDKPLIRSFMKYLTDSPSNTLLAIDFAKSLFRYSVPDLQNIDDPATLLNATRYVAEFTANGGAKGATDERFVRLLLHKIDKDPDLFTYDMIADMVESDAYKKFGSNNSQDKQNKARFEDWLINASTFAEIIRTPSWDVALDQDGLRRVVKALNLNDGKYKLALVDEKVNEFNEIFVKNVSPDTLENLKKIAQDVRGNNYSTQMKKIYANLCGQEYAEYYSNLVDSSVTSNDPKIRNSMLTGWGLNTNKILLGVARQKGWSDKDINDIYLKFPVEKSAEKFEERAQRRNAPKQQAASAAQDAQKQAAIQQDYLTSQQEYEALLGTKPNLAQAATKPEQNNIAPAKAKFNPVFDVVKTFSMTLTGAAAISTITSIPGVGQIVGPALGLTMVVGAGVSSGLAAMKEAKKKGELSKSDVHKIALKAGIAMVGKAWPYAAAMALGPAGRILGSGVVFAKTLYADLERRAGLQQEKAKGVFGKLKRFAEMGRSVSLSEGLKSLVYATSKSAAVLAGGTLGSELGSSIGSNVSFENGKPSLDKEGVVEDLKQTKVGKLFGRFKGLRGNEQSPMENLHPAGVDDGMTQPQPSSGNIQLSENNLERLSQIGEVELTEHARMTVHTDNHRQYVGGVQQDWYNSAQEETAMQTLRAAGVEDPAGVLRKVGSAARFFGGEYQATLDNLCAGDITDKDVNQIFGALRQINEEGGLGQIIKQPTYQTYEPVQEPVTTTEVPTHTQEYRTPASEVTDDLSASRFVPDEVTVDPIDVPPHTQEYRTPNTVEVAETQEVQESPYEGVDIDNSVDYIAEDNQFTNIDVPPHTQEYRTPNDSLTSEPTSIPIPSHTAEYTVSGVMGGEFQDVTYGGNDGENDYFIDDQGNEITANQNNSNETTSANEPAMLSDEQMARIRASWIRSGELDQEGMTDYLSSLNDEELKSTLGYLSDEELASINKMIPEPTVEKQPTEMKYDEPESTDFLATTFSESYEKLGPEVGEKIQKNYYALKKEPILWHDAPSSLEHVTPDNYVVRGDYDNGYNYTNSGMTDRSSVLSAIREHNQSLHDEPTMER